MKKQLALIINLLIFCSLFNGNLRAQDNLINVDYAKEIGSVNKKVFGNNFIAYDPSTYEGWGRNYYGYIDYGAGIWDPEAKKSVQEVIDLAKSIRMSAVRFPGGCGAHHYNWRNAVGQNRQHFLFGVDEFVQVAQELGAEPIYTLSYFVGDEHDAADLVKYLDSKIKYFEVGNEDWHGDHQKISSVTPQEYAFRYLKYYAAIKAADPAAQVGVILCETKWDKAVLSIIKGKTDFAVVHFYPGSEINENKIGKMPPRAVFTQILTSSIEESEDYLNKTQALLKQETGRDLPIAITEYNAGLTFDKPLPYRHTLGAALVNAELLRIFLKPQHNILMANYWQFSNSFWGMVFNKANQNYTKRPNYYVYELYAKHFGNTLIEAGSGVGLLTLSASKDSQAGKIYLAVLNKNMDADITCAINLKNFIPQGTLTVFELNGTQVEALNEDNPENVRVREKQLEINNASFSYIFPKHSLTFLEIEGKK